MNFKKNILILAASLMLTPPMLFGGCKPTPSLLEETNDVAATLPTRPLESLGLWLNYSSLIEACATAVGALPGGPAEPRLFQAVKTKLNKQKYLTSLTESINSLPSDDEIINDISDREIIAAIMDQGYRINLAELIYNGQWDIAQEIINHPLADVNAVNSDGHSPFFYALRQNKINAFNALLAAPGFDVNAGDLYGLSPLRYAALSNLTEIIQILFKTPRINVNGANTAGWTPLHIAASYGHTEVVRALLATPGIDVNAADENGETPLHLAIFFKRTEIVHTLLAAPEIDINAANSDGKTPLHIARNWGGTEIVDLLREAGAHE